jgi:hypothetical protein
MMAAGVRALDAWHAWVVEPSARTLDSLRQELLDQVAAQSPEAQGLPETGAPDPQLRHEILKKARAEAGEGNPRQITVRDLLELWGTDARDATVSQRIEADLANHGLASTPDFRKVTLDAILRLIGIPEKDETPEGVDPDAADAEEAPPRGLTLGSLPSALGGVVSVPPTASFEQAITLMLLNDYSQLAVLNGLRNLRGAVT